MRRASAASARTTRLYSSAVVAPIKASSPRASATFSSAATSSSPARTSFSSSKKRTTRPALDATSALICAMRSASAPRTPVPARSVVASISTTIRSSSVATSRPSAMRCARPRTTLVLPTPAGPTRHGQFACRLASTSSAWSISASRPNTGSSSPRAAASVRLRPSEDSAGKSLGSRSKRVCPVWPFGAGACLRLARGAWAGAAECVWDGGAGPAVGAATGTTGTGLAPAVRAGVGGRAAGSSERALGLGIDARGRVSCVAVDVRRAPTMPIAICMAAVRSLVTSDPHWATARYAAVVRSWQSANSR